MRQWINYNAELFFKTCIFSPLQPEPEKSDSDHYRQMVFFAEK